MIKETPNVYKAVPVDIPSAELIVGGSLDEETRQNGHQRSFLFTRVYWFLLGIFVAVFTLQAFCNHHKDDSIELSWNDPPDDDGAMSKSNISFTSFRDHSIEIAGEVPISKYVPSHDSVKSPGDSLDFETPIDQQEEANEMPERSHNIPPQPKSGKSSKSRPRHHSKSRPKSKSKSHSKSHKSHSHHHPKSHPRLHPNPFIEPRFHVIKEFEKESDRDVP
eukprot:CAMPEP_0184871858 /NCGR_PEP_ID=MMETSP0580-20130426/40960_1 /TAXON_ID=1118495 /ORGANISM="Dactyliosolen fragilissimus" /LENGTH=219 /DNA_ID=CAMNT_0027374575 /DNA_START=540 /DNA_END=1199 /DNA_ORIENTATION=+